MEEKLGNIIKGAFDAETGSGLANKVVGVLDMSILGDEIVL